MKVPFCDLLPQYLELKGETDAAIQNIVQTSSFIGGKPVEKFEQELAASIGHKHGVGACNATMVGWALLEAMGIRDGDEVITTPLTAVPTAEYMTLARAKPVFVDIDPATYQIDASKIEAAITSRTKAIMPVHLYGIPCDLDAILAIGKKHNLPVLEDCAQAQGAEYKGRRIGSFGLASCWSFFPSKNLGCWGDGGALTSNDDKIAEWVRMFCNHGRKEKFTHEFPGANLRLDALQAAILSIKLTKLDEWNAKRREVAKIYFDLLADVEEITLPATYEGSVPVWHVFVVRAQNRDGLMAHLKNAGIGTGLHYPLPLHQQPAMRFDYKDGQFPEAELATQQIVSLPMYPHMPHEMAHHVAAEIKKFYAKVTA
jgi:dTDP-4-amino-4,6-dideoxygalactose transaminase